MSLKYEELDAHFFGLGDDSPAAIQGFVTGLLCGNAPDDFDFILRAVARYLDAEDELDDNQRAMIEALWKHARSSLLDEGFEFQLLLPEDEAPLMERAGEVSLWVQGFLVGFGTASPREGSEAYSADVQGALTDLVAISQMEQEPEPDESSEQALMELEEYLRVVVQMLYTEQVLLGGGEAPVGKDSSTLH